MHGTLERTKQEVSGLSRRRSREGRQQRWEPSLLLSRSYFLSHRPCTLLCLPHVRMLPSSSLPSPLPDCPSAISTALSLGDTSQPATCWEPVLTVKDMALNHIRISGRRRLRQPLMNSHPAKIICCHKMLMCLWTCRV